MMRARGAIWTTIGALVSAAALSGCVHDDSSIFIQQVLQPPEVSAGQQCTFKADPTEPYINSGSLDISLDGAYWAEFLVGNQLISQSSPNQLQTETSDVNLQGAEVRVTDGEGNPILSFTTLSAATVFAASGGTPSWSLLGVRIIDSDVIQASPDLLALPTLYAQGTYDVVRIITYTKVFGKTLGGRYVESNEFEFPVDVCWGCLVTFSAADEDPCYLEPNCRLGSVATSTTSSVPCIIGQDDPVDCSECLGDPTCSPKLVPNPNLVNDPACSTAAADAGAD
jgi:hypothetical protein